MSLNVSDIAITSLETIMAFSLEDDSLLFTLDELQDATIAQSEEKSDITGKGGRKLTSLKKNKSVTISGNNGLVSAGLLARQIGSDLEEGVNLVQWTDYLTVESNSATTKYKAVGATGSEIEAVYKRNRNGSLGAKFTQNATLNKSGVFTYNPTTKVLTFRNGDLATGDKIVVFYKRNIKASVEKNISDSYSKKAALYIDAFGEDRCNNTYHIQIMIPRADFNGEFSFDMGGDQTVHSFEAEALSGACDADGELWSYTVFNSEAKDEDLKNGIIEDSDGEIRYYIEGIPQNIGLVEDGDDVRYFGAE